MFCSRRDVIKSSQKLESLIQLQKQTLKHRLNQ
nr:MAG TPA: hypothetical protein [Caudoviricetes sp.]